jgi:hypothetical protein
MRSAIRWQSTAIRFTISPEVVSFRAEEATRRLFLHTRHIRTCDRFDNDEARWLVNKNRGQIKTSKTSITKLFDTVPQGISTDVIWGKNMKRGYGNMERKKEKILKEN